MATWTVRSLPPPKGIVCKPLSTDNPNGFGDKPKQFIKLDYTNLAKPTGTYERDENGDYQLQTGPLATNGDSIYINTDELLYVQREMPDAIKGGNCYWVRAFDAENQPDGLVLSWDGPLGFGIAERPSITVLGANAPTNNSYTVLSDVTVTQDSSVNSNNTSYRIYSFSRFSSNLYAHGQVISTPGDVLGAAMINDAMVIVVAGGSNPVGGDQKNIDSVYYSKLSDISTIGWQLAGTIPVEIRANESYLSRSNCYAFSQDGLNIIGLVNSVYDSVTNSSNQLIAGFHLRRNIVRCSLMDDGLGNISVLSSTFTVSDDFQVATVTTTIVDSHNPMTGNRSGTTVKTIDYIYTSNEFIEAVGFFGNIESILKWTTQNHTRSLTSNISCNITNAVGSDTETLTDTESAMWVLSSSNGSIFTSSLVESSTLTKTQGSDIDRTRVDSIDSDDVILLFADINKDHFVYAHTNRVYTDSRSSNQTIVNGDEVITPSGVGSSDHYIVFMVSSVNGTLNNAIDDTVLTAAAGKANNLEEQPLQEATFCSLNDTTMTVVDAGFAKFYNFGLGDLKAMLVVNKDNDIVGSIQWEIINAQSMLEIVDFVVLPVSLTPEQVFDVSGTNINMVGSLTYSNASLVLFRL